jgi:hypothetical protein
MITRDKNKEKEYIEKGIKLFNGLLSKEKNQGRRDRYQKKVLELQSQLGDPETQNSITYGLTPIGNMAKNEPIDYDAVFIEFRRLLWLQYHKGVDHYQTSKQEQLLARMRKQDPLAIHEYLDGRCDELEIDGSLKEIA